MTETETETAQQEEVDAFDLHGIFNKQPEVDVAPTNDAPKKERVKKAEPVKKEKAVIEEDDDEDEDEDEPSASDKPKEGVKSNDVDYKSEFEKLQKTVKDTQRSFHEDRKKLAAYKKAVEKMKEDGALLDEEATMLLDHTKYENESVEDESTLVKYAKVWDKELEYMKKYAPDSKEIDQHILAFQHFMQTASREEINDALNDLSRYEDDEVELTRQMLELGRQYNDEIYADIHESGSIRNLKSKYSQKEYEMQKEIDKLKKRVDKLKEKYEDYNPEPANYKLASGSANMDLPKNVTFDPVAIFAKQFQRR